MRVDQAARLYGVPLIDYERPGDGLLVASGCGIMMAVMDQCPRLRWCVDCDSLEPGARLADFVLLAERSASVVAFCGWFSISDPTPLRAAASGLARLPLVYAGGGVDLGVGVRCVDLDEFIARLNAGAIGPSVVHSDVP